MERMLASVAAGVIAAIVGTLIVGFAQWFINLAPWWVMVAFFIGGFAAAFVYDALTARGARIAAQQRARTRPDE